MMKIITLLAAACFMTGAALAADRIVYVDFERIYRESKVVGAVQDELQVAFKDRQDALQQSQEEITALREALEREELTLSDAERNERERNIIQMEREFVRNRQAFLEDRTLNFRERRQVIDAEIERLIAELAKEKSYTIVLNPYLSLPISGGNTLRHNIILYADETADITEEVIELFDQEAKISR